MILRIESLDWIPYIIRIPLQCKESIKDFEYYGDYDPYFLDNYYSEQEYWFDGDEKMDLESTSYFEIEILGQALERLNIPRYNLKRE